MKRNKFIDTLFDFRLIFLFPFFFSCGPIKNKENKDFTLKTDEVIEDNLLEITNVLSDDELLIKWTWGEKNVIQPKKSKINHFKFDEQSLFKKWNHIDGGREFAFAFDASLFSVINESYLYTISEDSLRVFTQMSHLDGIDRGIINKLTEDSLIITWSTGDINSYTPS